MKQICKKRVIKLMCTVIALIMALGIVPIGVSAASPNNSFATAKAINLGENVTGRLENSDDTNYFRFDLPGNGPVKITYNFTSGAPYQYLSFYNSNRSKIFEKRLNDIPYPFISPQMRLPAGTYYILIERTYGGTTSPDPYTIRVDYTNESGRAYEIEPNNAFSTANQLTFGQKITANLNSSDDVDYFKFNVSASDDIVLTYNYTAGAPYHYMVVRDSSNKQLYNTRLADIPFPFKTNPLVLSPGDYYVLIERTYGGDTGNEDYTLEVNSVNGTSQPTPTPDPTPTPEPEPEPTPEPEPEPQPPVNDADKPTGFDRNPINVGVKLWWNSKSGGVGYRVYRSTQSGVEGISVTDFYITSNEFVDVNVDASTTYYYTIRQVLKEARPFEGLPEELGPASDQIQVRTGSTILGGNSSDSGGKTKQFILMTLDDPYMSANGIRKEIDPGRGTTPTIYNSRTLVPIRAIIEEMGGTVGWDSSSQKISLSNNGKNVNMWLNRRQITVNGSTLGIDVAPISINDRTMVPIRFATENLGCQIDWINSTRQIVVVYY